MITLFVEDGLLVLQTIELPEAPELPGYQPEWDSVPPPDTCDLLDDGPVTTEYRYNTVDEGQLVFDEVADDEELVSGCS